MKQVLFVVFIVFFFIACDQKPKNPVAEYGDAMINAYKKGQDAGETANLDAIRKTVQAYHALNDKYPQSLDEIKDLIGAKIDTSKYDYNSQTGAVNLKSK